MPLPTTNDLAGWTLDQQHPLTRGWQPAADRRALLADEHQLDLDLATDRGTATQRRARFGPDQPIELFLNCWEQIRPDLGVMLSIRWEGGDPDLPFVDASASTRSILSTEDISAAADRATLRYGGMRPRYLRWWANTPAQAIPGSSADKRFLAAPIHELAGRSVPDRLRLRPSTDLASYDRAVAAYASVDQAHPEHPRQAIIEPTEDLADLQEAGTLFDVLLDGAWVGYVGAEAGHKLGLSGYKVAELVLTDRARGHGYGSGLTTLLCRELNGRGGGDAVLIGTIHHDNSGALNAALRAGRADIGGWNTFPLTGASRVAEPTARQRRAT